MHIRVGILFGGLVVAGVVTARAAEPPSLDEVFGTTVDAGWSAEEHRQYDFWIGTWEGRWRFPQPDRFFHPDVSLILQHWVFPILDGKALVELSLSESEHARARVAGFSLRYYDSAKERWVMAQDWPGWTRRGFFDQLQGFERSGRVQVYSTFRAPTGEIRTRRYQFSDIRDGYFRWDSASTPDSGRTWAEGSIVEFHRTSSDVDLGLADGPMPNMSDLRYCPEPGFERLDALVGTWFDPLEGARITAVPFNAGCAVMAMLDWEDGPPTFYAWTHAPEEGLYTQLSLPGRPDATHRLWVASTDDTSGVFSFVPNDALVIRDELELLDLSEPVPEWPMQRMVWQPAGDVLTLRWERRVGGEWELSKELQLHREKP